MIDKSKGKVTASPRTVSAAGGSVAVGGDVVGSSIHVGDVHAGGRVDLKEFLEQLAELREGLRKAPLDAGTAEDLDAEAEGVKRQAERDKPNPAMIAGKLKTIAETLTSVAGAGEKLVPLARRLGEMASYLF
jgi:hypothetical protein